MASKDVRTNIEVTAETRDATSALEAVETAARDAEEAVEDLSKADVDVDTSDAVDDLAKIDTASEDAATALKRIGDTPVDVDESDALAGLDRIAAQLKEITDAEHKVDINTAPAVASLDKVRTSADQTGSVMANMVGNTTSDLAGLAGIGGTVGQALGQIGEYATEGGIGLQSLVRSAGPMLGIAAVGIGVSLAIKAIGREAEDARKEVEFFVEQQEKLREGKFDEVASALADQYKGTIAAAKEMGLTTQDVTGHMIGAGDATVGLKEKLKELEAAEPGLAEQGGQLRAEWLKQKEDLQRLITNLDNAKESFGKAKTGTKEHEEATKELSEALKADLAPALVDTGGRVRDFSADTLEAKAAAEEATTVVEQFDAKIRLLLGQIDEEQAWLNLKARTQELKEEMYKAGSGTDAHRLALLQLQEEQIKYVAGLEGIPVEKKTEIIAVIREGDFEATDKALEDLARDRDATINVRMIGVTPGGRKIPVEDLIMGGTSSVAGAPAATTRGAPTAQSSTSSFVGVPSVGTVIINMPRTADGQAVTAAVADWTRVDGRPQGSS